MNNKTIVLGGQTRARIAAERRTELRNWLMKHVPEHLCAYLPDVAANLPANFVFKPKAKKPATKAAPATATKVTTTPAPFDQQAAHAKIAESFRRQTRAKG